MVFRSPGLGLVAILMMPIPSHAEIKVGVDLALTGPNSSLGIPYRKGLDAMPKTVAGESIRLIVLDDASDPSSAVRNAQKLINDDNVDLIIGPSSTPAAFAIAPIAAAAHVPEIALSPVELSPQDSHWVVTIPQPGRVWILPILKDMQERGVKTVAFIGFSDPWGDLCLKAFKDQADRFGIKLVTEERYARTDTSVTGQILQILSKKPDAIFIGASGTPGALPHLTLADRHWKGPTYGQSGNFQQRFLEAGGTCRRRRHGGHGSRWCIHAIT